MKHDLPKESYAFGERPGAVAFRKSVMARYENKCVLSGCTCPEALDATHIRPYAGEHTDVVSNGLLLRNDLRHIFNAKKIVFSRRGEAVVCVCTNTYYAQQFDGHELHIIDPITIKLLELHANNAF